LEKAEAEGLEKFLKLVTQINTSNMICFDSNGKIKKYNSPEEILEEFYVLRLSYYQKRKVCLRVISFAANLLLGPATPL
jgi:DNA topoisomerase-2